MAESTGKLLLRIAPVTYGPNTMFGLGEGALIPIVPVIAIGLGADIAAAGLVASMLVIGRMIGNLPAGWLVARVGERWAVFGASILGLATIVTAAFSTTLAVFAATMFVIGLCDSAFGIARHSFMTTRVPIAFRARSISLLGGTYKFGIFVGPFVSALLLEITGNALTTMWFFAAMFIGIALLVLIAPDPETQFDEMVLENTQQLTDTPHSGEMLIGEPAGMSAGVNASTSARPHPSAVDNITTPTGQIRLRDQNAGVFRTMVNYRTVLLRLGVAAASFSAVRAARQVLLPLWGLSIGLDAQGIAIIIGISGAIDFALFYASGQVMDRFGRLWAALPALLIQAVGFVALAFTHELENAVLWFAILASFIAVGNGFASGILMTLGADVAPQRNPAPFLGSWRTLTDAGGAFAPIVLSGIAAVTVLAVPIGLVGVIGFAGAIGIWRQLPRFVSAPPRRSAPPNARIRETAEPDSLP